MNWNLNDLPLFIAVAESNSFSKAAVRLNIQKSSISRQ
ncbi:Transcriptional regulator LysR family protein [Moritella viscosa]|nr:LysR family transcriptional regulator [Moritella viscosa]SHO01549.1 Transcriptional regulator LysR family protein [Moritella viscosa]SHO20531.1 Transcriptional regulator LysR family protein [Moritella viscosa]